MKPFPLQSLLELSNQRMDDAGRRLGRLLADEREVEKTLALLEQYREEYERRFREAARNGLSREQWHNYQSFLARLDEAVRQQRTVVAASKQRTQDGQREWLDRRNQVKAFDTLSQRHQRQEARLEARREQRREDERAAQGGRNEER